MVHVCDVKPLISLRSCYSNFVGATDAVVDRRESINERAVSVEDEQADRASVHAFFGVHSPTTISGGQSAL